MSSPRLSAQRTVLYVDSSPLGAAAFRRLVRSLPVRVRLAAGGVEALAILAAEPVALLISEQRLRDMSGVLLALAVRKAHPGTRIVLHTAEDLSQALQGVDIPVLFKPCDPEDLRELVAAACGQG